MDELAPYAELLAMARREQELIHAGAWDELVELGRDRAVVAARLPARAPAAARVLLERTHLIIAGNLEALCVARAHTGEALGALRRGREARRGYAGGAPAPSRIDAIS